MLVFQGTLVHATEDNPLEILDNSFIGIEDRKGTLVHATEDNSLEILENAFIGVQNKKISFVEPCSTLERVSDKYGLTAYDVRVLDKGQFLIPGFVDAHLHAPQYPNSGLGLDLPLLQWLEKYTYPLEQRFADPHFARLAYGRSINRVLRNGTTTASYFATIHLEASLILSEIIDDLGQRAYIGKVNMDRNCPDTYKETTEASLRDTEQFVRALVEKQNPLLTPVITPRFPPSTSSSLMVGLASIAKEHNLPIQSHISENIDEIKWIKDLFPEQASYADVFRAYGLLSNKTVLAHGVHLSDLELQVLRTGGTSIAHCPNSNISICSGLFDTRNALDLGVTVGLGTDVSGGYSSSILDAQRQAVQTSKITSFTKNTDYKPITYMEAFRLATLGGAQALGLEDTIGNFTVGKDFDALLVDTNCKDSPLDVFQEHSSSEIIEKFLHLGDDRNLKEIYVSGRCVIHNTNKKA